MNHVIIVCGGSGKRMQAQKNKVFLTLSTKPILAHTIEPFQKCEEIHTITIVIRSQDMREIENIVDTYSFTKVGNIIEGGPRRQDSVYNGLSSLDKVEPNDIILVHNGCNPFIQESEIKACIKNAKEHGASVCAQPAKDTIKQASQNIIEKTLDRSKLYHMQTPQAIQYELFKKAYNHANMNNLQVTDDVSLVEEIGEKVIITSCSYQNIKITTPEDLKLAKGIIMSKHQSHPVFKVGFGTDSHIFSQDKQKPLILGGYTIPDEQGLHGNSDADVILHALVNALSQTIGGKSLGHYADPLCEKGITDSKEYVKHLLNLLTQHDLKLNNVGVMIEAAKPKLDPHTRNIKKEMMNLLKLQKNAVSITATSGEGLTSFGKGEGIHASVIVSVTSF